MTMEKEAYSVPVFTNPPAGTTEEDPWVCQTGMCMANGAFSDEAQAYQVWCALKTGAVDPGDIEAMPYNDPDCREIYDYEDNGAKTSTWQTMLEGITNETAQYTLIVWALIDGEDPIRKDSRVFWARSEDPA